MAERDNKLVFIFPRCVVELDMDSSQELALSHDFLKKIKFTSESSNYDARQQQITFRIVFHMIVAVFAES